MLLVANGRRIDPPAVIRACTVLLHRERVPQPWMYFNRGLALKMLGRLHDARRDYSEAIRLDPTFAAAHTNRANVLLLLNDTAGALADYREAINLDPNDHVARQNLEAIELRALRRLNETKAAGDVKITPNR